MMGTLTEQTADSIRQKWEYPIETKPHALFQLRFVYRSRCPLLFELRIAGSGS